MKYRQIGATDMKASVLSLGTWEIGGGSVWSGADDDESVRIIHEAAESGVNFIDTAPLYGMGHAEEVIARAVKGRRQEFLIASKFTLNWEDRGAFQFERDGLRLSKDFSAEGLVKDLDGILSRLKTDYLDVFYAHRNIPEEDIPEVIDALKRLRKWGKIRAIGLSNMGAAQFRLFQEAGCLDAVQEQYSILTQEDGDAFFPPCEEHGVTFHGYSALARGVLTGRLKADDVVEHQAHRSFGWLSMERRADVTALLDGWRPLCEKYACSLSNLALAWAIAQSERIVVAFGVRRLENLRDSLRSAELVLDGADAAKMSKDAAVLREKYKR